MEVFRLFQLEGVKILLVISHFQPLFWPLLEPSPHMRLNFQKKMAKCLVKKVWTKSGVICENLASGYQITPKK